LEACKALSADAARLECYDQIANFSPVLAQTVFADQQFRGSLLDSRWELARDSKLGTFQLRAYKPIYVLPVAWTNHPNRSPQSSNPSNSVTTPIDLQNIEAKLQFGFKTKIASGVLGGAGDVWFGYTQDSRWQVYNSRISRPFRETNYEPEAMLVLPISYGVAGWHGRMVAIGINHQSNGQTDPLSRSWNRVILNIGLDRQHWSLNIRPWLRISEAAHDDNNPDIEDYVGRADATLIYSSHGNEVALVMRHSLRGGDRSHGSVQLDWAFPLSGHLHGHLQVFDGYGESLIDYNHRALYLSLGVSLLEWY
jgi:phospholipase A1/A2